MTYTQQAIAGSSIDEQAQAYHGEIESRTRCQPARYDKSL